MNFRISSAFSEILIGMCIKSIVQNGKNWYSDNIEDTGQSFLNWFLSSDFCHCSPTDHMHTLLDLYLSISFLRFWCRRYCTFKFIPHLLIANTQGSDCLFYADTVSCRVKPPSRVRRFATSWTVAHQAVPGIFQAQILERVAISCKLAITDCFKSFWWFYWITYINNVICKQWHSLPICIHFISCPGLVSLVKICRIFLTSSGKAGDIHVLLWS